MKTTNSAMSLTVQGDLTIYHAKAQKQELLVASESPDLDLSQIAAEVRKLAACCLPAAAAAVEGDFERS